MDREQALIDGSRNVAKRRTKPGPKGPDEALIRAVVEMKRRNPKWGCPRIAGQIELAFGISINKDVVRRILAAHYRPSPKCNQYGFERNLAVKLGVEGLPVVIKPFDIWTTHDMMNTATKCCKFVLEPPRSLFGEFDSIQTPFHKALEVPDN